MKRSRCQSGAQTDGCRGGYRGEAVPGDHKIISMMQFSANNAVTTIHGHNMHKQQLHLGFTQKTCHANVNVALQCCAIVSNQAVFSRKAPKRRVS